MPTLTLKKVPTISDFKVTMEPNHILEEFQKGHLLVLSIARGKALTVRITPDMLGLDKFPDRTKPGHIWLVNETALAPIKTNEAQARYYLHGRSYQVTEASRSKINFVRHDKLGEVLLVLEGYKDKDKVLVDKFLDDYPELIEKRKEELAAQYAKDVAENPATAVDLWPFLEGKYPSIDDLRAGFGFAMELRPMVMPQQFGDISVPEMLSRLDLEDKHKNLLSTQASENESRLRRILNEQSDAQKQTLLRNVEEIMRDLRGQVVESFQNFLDMRTAGKPVQDRSLDAMRRILDHVRRMDFLEGGDFKDRLAAVELQLNKGLNFQTNDSAVKALEETLRGTVEFLNETTNEAIQQVQQTYIGRNFDV